MVEVDRELCGVVPIVGAFRLVVTIPATCPTVRKAVLSMEHPLIGRVVLNPAEFVAGDEEVVSTAVAEVVDGGSVSKVEVGVCVHFRKGGLVLGPKVEAHVDEESDLVLDGSIGREVGLVEDGEDSDGGDRHLVVELAQSVQILGKRCRPPQEVVPVFRSASEVDKFFRGRDKSGVVNALLPVLGVFFLECWLEVEGAEVFQNVIENLADVGEGRVAIFVEEGCERSDLVGLEDSGVVESVGGRHLGV